MARSGKKQIPKKPGRKKGSGHQWAKAFLAELSNRGVVTLSCKAAGIGHQTAYDYREQSPEFAALWDEAINKAADRMEAEAIRRGRDGVRKPVYQGGECVGYVQEYSDTLLIFMLKAVRPERFRERTEMIHKGTLNVSANSKADDDRQKRIDQLLDKRGRNETGAPAIAGPAD
jgi:hypothetical protein